MIKKLFLYSVFVVKVCLGSVTAITTVAPPMLHKSVTNDWYMSQGCSVSITEPDFVFVCDKGSIFTLPRSDVNAVLSSVDIEWGQVTRVFPGSSPDRLLLLVKEEASRDIISPGWIILELSIEVKANERDVQVRPVFSLPDSQEPEWLRMAEGRTWLMLVRKSD